MQGSALEAAVSMEYPVLNQQSLQDSRTIRGTMKSLLLLLGLLLLGSPGQGRDSEQGLASQEVSDKELQGEWRHCAGPGCTSLRCASLGWHCPPDSFWGPPALGSLIPEHSDTFSLARVLPTFPLFWLRRSVRRSALAFGCVGECVVLGVGDDFGAFTVLFMAFPCPCSLGLLWWWEGTDLLSRSMWQQRRSMAWTEFGKVLGPQSH